MVNSIALVSALVKAINTIRLTYSAFPLTARRTGTFDALNSANYTIIGPNVGPFKVNTVVDHPECVDIVLDKVLSPGVWTVTVSNVQMYDGTVCPTKTIALPISQQLLTVTNAGSIEEGVEGYLRKAISRAFKGRVWDALISSLALSDRYNLDNARSTFAQIWKSTASGIYLDRKASGYGISRPPNVGLSDDLFRQLVVKSSTNKLTEESLLEVLEIFYGPSSVRAICSSTTSSPFTLSNGYDLQLLIDGKQTINVIFNSNDFANITKASAIEVASAITRACATSGSNAYAYPYIDPTTGTASVNIVSSSLGIGSSIIVTGGHAQNVLRFPSLITNTGIENVATTLGWTITTPQTGIARYTQNSGTTIDLSFVQVGDYFNFFSTGYNNANRGTWTISNVFVSPTSQFIDVANVSAVAETVSSNGAAADALFFRPVKSTIYSSVSPVISSQNGNQLTFTLPATSQAVARSEFSGAYLQSVKTLPISSLVQTPDGNVTITSTSHGLSVGQQVMIDGVSVSANRPSINSGTTSKTSSSIGSVCSMVTAPTWANGNSRNSSYIASIPNGVFLFGGLPNNNTSFLGGNNRLGGTMRLGGGTAPSTGLTDAYRYVFAAGSPTSDGSIPYTYTTPTTAACPTGMGFSNALSIPLTNKIFVSGGVTNFSTFALYNGFYTYDYVANTWTAGPTYTTARASSALVYLSGKILVVGGNTAANTFSSEITAINAPSLTVASTTSLKVARGTGVNAIPILNGSKALVFGGADTGLTEVIDSTGTVTATSRMSHTHAFGATGQLLPDGRVLVIGGVGRMDTLTGSPFFTQICEIYDPVTNSWSPTASTTSTRQSPSIFLCTDTNRVYALGGSSSGTIEFYNISTGRWIPAPWGFALGGRLANNFIPVNTSTNLLFMYGADSVNSTNTSEMLIVGADSFATGRINGIMATISAVPTSNSIQFKSDKVFSGGTNGTLTLFSATKAIIPGPYMYDTRGGAAVTAIETSLTTTLNKGMTYQSIPVSSTAGFPPSGLVSFGFGTSLAVYPVKYIGVLGNNLLLDASFVFPSTVSSGAKVTFLTQRAPFVPLNPQKLGSLYLTDSASGRIGAQASITSNAAAGVNTHVFIKYPGDRGLGGEGFPTHDATKLSDVVGVFGSDDITTDLANARIN